MGQNSKRRREEKRRAEQRRVEQRRRENTAAPPGSTGRARERVSSGGPSTGAVRELVDRAIAARISADLGAYDQAVDRLAAPHEVAGPDLVSAFVLGELSRRLRSCWRGGWQPVDIVNVVRRLESATHAEVAAAAIASDAANDRDQPMHPQWSSQLEELGWWWSDRDTTAPSWLSRVAARLGLGHRNAIEAAIDLLVRLARLPVQPQLIPPPGPGAAASSRRRPEREGSAIDAKMLVRVRALLAKAESTEFPEEAESLTEKAQELMTRYSIDMAMLHAASGVGSDGPEGRRIHLEPPYIDAKAALANQVASANRCRVVLASDLGFVTVFGFGTDLAVVDVLFTSLLAQATTAMVAAGRVVSRAGVSKTRSFRQSFLVSYAHRIGERLREAASATTKDAEATFGASLLPVLVRREADVDEAVAGAFPNLTSRRTRVSNAAGWEAGRVAADLASLGSWAQLR